jgi:hypothetical protein
MRLSTLLFATGLILGSSSGRIKLVVSSPHSRLENTELRIDRGTVKAGSTKGTILQARAVDGTFGLGINEAGQLIVAEKPIGSLLTTDDIAELNAKSRFMEVPAQSGYKIFLSSENLPSHAVPITLQVVPAQGTIQIAAAEQMAIAVNSSIAATSAIATPDTMPQTVSPPSNLSNVPLQLLQKSQLATSPLLFQVVV